MGDGSWCMGDAAGAAGRVSVGSGRAGSEPAGQDGVHRAGSVVLAPGRGGGVAARRGAGRRVGGFGREGGEEVRPVRLGIIGELRLDVLALVVLVLHVGDLAWLAVDGLLLDLDL